MEIPTRLQRKMDEDKCERLIKAVSEVHKLLIYEKEEGLKDLNAIFPFKTEKIEDIELYDYIVVSILTYLKEKYHYYQYKKVKDKDIIKF